MSKKNIGSSFDNFLSENAMLDEAAAVAVKNIIAWQIEHEMKAQNMNKTTLAKTPLQPHADHAGKCCYGAGEDLECRVDGGLKINRVTS